MYEGMPPLLSFILAHLVQNACIFEGQNNARARLELLRIVGNANTFEVLRVVLLSTINKSRFVRRTKQT